MYTMAPTVATVAHPPCGDVWLAKRKAETYLQRTAAALKESAMPRKT